VVTELADFPFVADLPKREKSKVAKALDAMAELETITAERGPLIPQAVAAKIVGVSGTRIGQLLDAGAMDFHTVNGDRYIFVRSFREFAKRERKTGRPPGPSKQRLALT
jgi:hypothetical protein